MTRVTYSTQPFIIRNNERLTFKGCRRKWYFSSQQDGNLGLEKKERHSALWVGTGVHVGLQKYYQTGQDRGPFPSDTFADWARDWRRRNVDLVSRWDIEEEAKYVADVHLGVDMLTHYETEFAPVNDLFTVVKTEQEFRVPLLDLRGRPLWVTVYRDGVGVRRPAYYAGRFDGIVRTDDGLLWLLEHKTAAQLIDVRKLTNDEQVGSYIWAAQRIYGLELAGVIYNVLYKRTPTAPETVYKGKALSRSEKTLATTTYERYFDAINAYGFDPADYVTELTTLKEAGLNNFFFRIQVMRAHSEIDEFSMRLMYEAIDMTRRDLYIYPNAVPMICPWCPFREPCQAMSDGGDYEYILAENYRPRVSDFEPAGMEMPY